MPRATSNKARLFTESVIREMTRLCAVHDAINLAQGYPDFPAPPAVKEAARRAIDADVNQYPVTWGAENLRCAIAEKYRRFYDWEVDPEREITVTCGSTEGMIATMLALVDPGDEVVIFEPFYENYGPDAILSGATPRYVPLEPPDWRFDPERLAAVFSDRTRAVIVNSPNNPTGKVFTGEELQAIADLCCRHDALVFTDEIYEHMVYDGGSHVPMASIPGMAERTVTISALSKSYSVTGWRVGWAIAAPPLTDAIRKVHDFLTVAAPAPLQEAGVTALGLGDDYYADLTRGYTARREILVEGLRGAGFKCGEPAGAYYVIADASAHDAADDVAFARRLVEETGVGAVPGSSFFSEAAAGRNLVRFAFAKRESTLRDAVTRLAGLSRRGPRRR